MIVRTKTAALAMLAAALIVAALPGRCTAQTADDRVEELIKRAQELQRQAEIQAQAVRATLLRGGAADNRLGATLEAPTDILINQLGLTQGQGLVVKRVTPNSAAAKAGLQANDILIELDGKPVASNVAEFNKAADGIKADTPVDAVVLRKGQKTTVKGIVMAQAPAPGAVARRPFGAMVPPAPVQLQINGNTIQVDGAGNPIVIQVSPDGKGASTVTRDANGFTAKFVEGTLTITVNGTIADSKAKVQNITVKDGAGETKYAELSKVPDKFLEQAKKLVELGEQKAPAIPVNPKPAQPLKFELQRLQDLREKLEKQLEPAK
jgi:membrane-associated protease RseP (regulator of RpoE activity)